MFSTQDNPFDTCSSFYENPTSTSFLMSFPTSLLNDEELLFHHLLHHQSPPSTATADTIVVGPSDKARSGLDSMNPNSMNKEELGQIIATETKSSIKSKSKAKTQAEEGGGGSKRKRVIGAKKQPGSGATPSTARRRTGKKDRHSKIYTAQGPRDRRMRLSLQIARKFFDLQDMLGFDKASKTIEWLFAKSKPAIRDLTASLPPHQRKQSLMVSCPSVSSTSTTVEDVVGINDQPNSCTRSESKPSTYSSPIAKESRERARARARQRTMEKNKQKELMLKIISPNTNNVCTTNNNVSTPETVDQEVSMAFNSQPQQPSLENQMSSVSIIEKLLGSDSSASSSSIYDECSYLGFAGNWATDSLRMYPSYGAISGVDELQVILQQQNPKCVSLLSSPGMHFQSNDPENQIFSNSHGRNLI